MSSRKRNYEKIDWSDSGESEPEENIGGNSIKISDRRCPYCIQLFKSSLDLSNHEKICIVASNCNAKRVTCKDGSKKFICQFCCGTYKYLNLFQLHEKKHELPGGFFCKYCDFRCCHDVKLEKHKEEAHKEFLCRLCNMNFETKETYIDHILINHDGRDKDYKVCENCGRQFRYTEHLNYHKNTNCQTIFPFKCIECGKSFRSKGILKTHSLIHSGEKKFTCSFCPMSFICKAQVVVHERKHTGEKPYKCEICLKAFAHRESLVTHSSTHTGMKPYLCECCDARFSCVSSILAHRRTRPDTCGLPQYCTKLAKACPRHTFRSKPSAEKRVISSARVIKTSDKEKLKEKLIQKRKIIKKSSMVENLKIKEHNREKNNVNEDDINSNSNENLDKFRNVDCIKINNVFKCKVLIEKINILSTVAKPSSDIKNIRSGGLIKTSEKGKYKIGKAIAKRYKRENIYRKKKFINSNSKKQVEKLQNFDSMKIKNSQLLIEENNISNFKRERSKRNIKAVNYTENYKAEIENNFQDSEVKDENILNHRNGYSEEEQPKSKKDCLKIKVKVEANNSQIVESKYVIKEISKIGDKIKTETYFEDYQSIGNLINKNKEICVIENLESTRLSNCVEINKDSDNSNNTYTFLDSLSFEDNINDVEDDSININDKSSNKLPVKTIVYENPDHRLTNEDQNRENNKSCVNKKKTEDIFECIECINKQPFRRKISYEKHLRIHHNKTNNDIIEILSIKNHRPSNFSCKMCGKSFTYLKSLNQHLKLHGIDGKLIIQCKTCLNYFATKEDLLQHAEKYHKNDITCLICNKMYKNMSSLKAHERYAHRERKNNNIESKKKLTFICNKCGKVFSSKTSLITHELSKCGTEHQYKCKECGKALYSPTTLKTHMMIHSGELPFLCPFCSKGFRTKAPMIVHQRMHTGEKPFQCTYCEKAFAYRENLFIHMSTHTGIKRYMCTTCSERFSCISGLKNHWRTHSETCGADPKRTTKAFGEFMGYRKGQLEHQKKIM